MKAKLEYCLRWLREGAVRVVRSYPVETLLALYACIRCLLTYELDWSEEELFNRLGLVPLFFALALAVNNLAGRGPWRKVYWVVWAPIVPLTLWSGLGDWIESASFRISLGILAPLLLLLSLRAVRNDRFVNGALVWLRSGALALLFANVALGLFYAILYSATYIFGLGGAWIEHVAVWSVTICETLAVPLLFLMSDETRMGMSKKKYCWAIALLIVTILSTLSTTGFICLGVVLLTVAFRKKGRKMARSIKMAAFVGLVLLFVIESVTGVVERKIVGRNSGGSFYTRWNDTFSGFEIGLESPIAGQGVFSERKAEILLKHRVQNISNGFAAFVMDTGLILPAVWLWLTYRGIRTKFAKARLLYVLGVFLLYFLCINTEGVFLNILFLGLLGKWQPDAEDTPDQQANARSQKKRRWRCTVPPEKLRLTFNPQPGDAAQEQTGETGGEES